MVLVTGICGASRGVTVRDFENRTFTGSTGDTLRYRLFVPKDQKNPVANSRLMFKALQAVGANAKYTEVPDARHNCWDAAYATEELHDWLFSQSLSKR